MTEKYEECGTDPAHWKIKTMFRDTQGMIKCTIYEDNIDGNRLQETTKYWCIWQDAQLLFKDFLQAHVELCPLFFTKIPISNCVEACNCEAARKSLREIRSYLCKGVNETFVINSVMTNVETQELELQVQLDGGIPMIVQAPVAIFFASSCSSDVVEYARSHPELSSSLYKSLKKPKLKKNVKKPNWFVVDEKNREMLKKIADDFSVKHNRGSKQLSEDPPASQYVPTIPSFNCIFGSVVTPGSGCQPDSGDDISFLGAFDGDQNEVVGGMNVSALLGYQLNWC